MKAYSKFLSIRLWRYEVFLSSPFIFRKCHNFEFVFWFWFWKRLRINIWLGNKDWWFV